MIASTTPRFEIDNEMRAVAERSMEQVKQAVNNYMRATEKAVSALGERVETSQRGGRSGRAHGAPQIPRGFHRARAREARVHSARACSQLLTSSRRLGDRPAGDRLHQAAPLRDAPLDIQRDDIGNRGEPGRFCTAFPSR